MLTPALAVDGLELVAALQHLAGVGSAIALYALAMRLGANRWLAALAAAPLLLDGYQIQIEQLIMSDIWQQVLLVALLWVLLGAGAPNPRRAALEGIPANEDGCARRYERGALAVQARVPDRRLAVQHCSFPRVQRTGPDRRGRARPVSPRVPAQCGLHPRAPCWLRSAWSRCSRGFGLGRARTSGLRSATLLAVGMAVTILLASAAFEFSWRYQLPGLVLLPFAGVLGITALLRRRACLDGPVICRGPARLEVTPPRHPKAAGSSGPRPEARCAAR